jgi:prevent-host-death family protein
MAKVPTKVLRQLKESGEPTVITQRGRAAAVMLSLEEFERAENERQILLLLAKGEKEIDDGVGHGLAEVFAEADKLLEGIE